MMHGSTKLKFGVNQVNSKRTRHSARIRVMIDIEGFLACKFCVNQAFHFSIRGSTFSSGTNLHVVQESVSPIPFMGQVDMQRQRYWKIGPTKTFVLWFVVYVQNISPHRNSSQVYKELWVIHFEAFYLYVVSSFACVPVICTKLVLFLAPLQLRIGLKLFK